MRSSLVVLALVAAGCGDPVNDLSLASAPFTTVRAHVDLAAIVGKAGGKPILAGLVWGSVPSIPAICYQQKGDSIIDAACPDPYGFFAGIIDHTVVLDPTGSGNIDLPLDHLPSANALVGTDVSNVAYGTLLVVADLDGNGSISIQPRATSGRGGAMGGGMGGPGGQPQPEVKADLVLATSFATLTTSQGRIAYHEGAFTGLELFYAAPKCGAPPNGFSILKTGSYLDDAATCEALGLEHRLEVPVVDAAAATAFACRTVRSSTVLQQPGAETGMGPGGGEAPKTPDLTGFHCLGQNLLVLPVKGTCPSFTAYGLKGCRLDPECKTPDWDVTATPPEWWPCTE